MNELDIIRIVVETIGQPKPRFSRIGDDVAYLPTKKGRVVIKSDMLVEKTDVPKGMKLWQVARKSMAMCVSDFAAKGVIPSAALISLGIPRGMGEREIRELAKGFKKAKGEFGVEILGGDTNEAEGLVIDCCMIGFADAIVERKGAKPGDLVITSGFFGYSSSGLKIMLDGLKAEPKFRERAVSAVVMPQPKLKLGVALARNNIISSSIDSSDGLAFSLYEIANNGRVGIEIDSLPMMGDVRIFADMNGLDLNDLVLYGGEEYEIVATMPADELDRAYKVAKRIGEKIIVIGKVIEGIPKVYLLVNGKEVSVERRGWVHFK
ncbi:MAG: thiamine-phosphate kinase [Nitrososphaerales archaeon]|nr:thiamine-phosphate kinase [Nitrososphaerales archaeon]